MSKQKDIEQVLRKLGASGRCLGFEYISYSVSQALKDRRLLQYVTKGIYLETAKKYQTSIKCVERDIRTVVKSIWEYGDRELLEGIAGKELNERPCNGEFIDMLVEHMKKE